MTRGYARWVIDLENTPEAERELLSRRYRRELQTALSGFVREYTRDQGLPTLRTADEAKLRRGVTDILGQSVSATYRLSLIGRRRAMLVFRRGLRDLLRLLEVVCFGSPRTHSPIAV